MSRTAAVFILVAAAALGALIDCGGGDPSPTTGATPLPSATPEPTPTPASGLPAGMVCDPTPPPLYGILIEHHSRDSDRTVLVAKPIVINVREYCGRMVGTGGKWCETRRQTDPQKLACDSLAVGRALDTNEWGPTWYYEDRLCDAANAGNCANYAQHQFLVYARNAGRFSACASLSVPVDIDGSRCGTCAFDLNGHCK